MLDHEYLAEESVSVHAISHILRRAYLKHELDEDGDIKVYFENVNLFVLLDEERKLIKLLSSYGFSDEASELDRLQLANEINRRFIFIGVHATETSLVGEYYLSYEEGILPYQLMNSLRKFADVFPAAVRKSDVKDIIK